MSDTRAIVLGATGLTGGLLVRQLLQDDRFNKIRVLVRRPLDLQHPKLEQEMLDFKDMASFQKAIETADTIFCCIGTTMKNVKGDKQRYREIDFDISVNAGRMGFKKGVKKYILVSAVGADPSSRNFYLRLKGELEKAIAGIGFESVYIMRPSMLLGERKEFRPGELLTKPLILFLSFLLAGRLKKYKAIRAGMVAAAMIAAGKQGLHGLYIYEYADMKALAATLRPHQV